MSRFDPKIVAGSPRRNRFDLSYYSRVTSRMGDLVPVLCKKIVPSDEFRVSINAITRFAPLANPIYDRLRIDYDAFFVQNRIIDPQFKEFLTGGIGLYGETSTEGMENIKFQYTFETVNDAKEALGNASLLDYLGFGLSSEDLEGSNLIPFVFNAEPVLGYHKIYEDWYRNERFQSPAYSEIMKKLVSATRFISGGRWDDTDKWMISLHKRNFYKDPYTTALSEPLIGGVIPIMSGTAPVITSPFDAAEGAAIDVTSDNKVVVSGAGNSLVADLSSVVSNTVQQLNQMYALYRFFMKDTYNGNRYVEFIESHFDVRVPDSTLERPLFLGRYTQMAAFSEVFQTSGSTVQSGDEKNVLGDYAGKGVSAGSGFLFQEKFLEHGLLYIIMSITPESTYFQGISPVFLYGDRFDSFYFPEFQNIGDDIVPLCSLYSKSLFSEAPETKYFDANIKKSRNKIFGYQRRNWDMIWYPNELHGLFRLDNKMYNWTFARKFANPPVLGDAFAKIPEINNPFTYNATDAEPFYTDIYFNIQALRPIERYESITTH